MTTLSSRLNNAFGNVEASFDHIVFPQQLEEVFIIDDSSRLPKMPCRSAAQWDVAVPGLQQPQQSPLQQQQEQQEQQQSMPTSPGPFSWGDGEEFPWEREQAEAAAEPSDPASGFFPDPFSSSAFFAPEMQTLGGSEKAWLPPSPLQASCMLQEQEEEVEGGNLGLPAQALPAPEKDQTLPGGGGYADFLPDLMERGPSVEGICNSTQVAGAGAGAGMGSSGYGPPALLPALSPDYEHGPEPGGYGGYRFGYGFAAAMSSAVAATATDTTADAAATSAAAAAAAAASASVPMRGENGYFLEGGSGGGGHDVPQFFADSVAAAVAHAGCADGGGGVGGAYCPVAGAGAFLLELDDNNINSNGIHNDRNDYDQTDNGRAGVGAGAGAEVGAGWNFVQQARSIAPAAVAVPHAAQLPDRSAGMQDSPSQGRRTGQGQSSNGMVPRQHLGGGAPPLLGTKGEGPALDSALWGARSGDASCHVGGSRAPPLQGLGPNQRRGSAESFSRALQTGDATNNFLELEHVSSGAEPGGSSEHSAVPWRAAQQGQAAGASALRADSTSSGGMAGRQGGRQGRPVSDVLTTSSSSRSWSMSSSQLALSSAGQRHQASCGCTMCRQPVCSHTSLDHLAAEGASSPASEGVGERERERGRASIAATPVAASRAFVPPGERPTDLTTRLAALVRPLMGSKGGSRPQLPGGGSTEEGASKGEAGGGPRKSAALAGSSPAPPAGGRHMATHRARSASSQGSPPVAPGVTQQRPQQRRGAGLKRQADNDKYSPPAGLAGAGLETEAHAGAGTGACDDGTGGGEWGQFDANWGWGGGRSGDADGMSELEPEAMMSEPFIAKGRGGHLVQVRRQQVEAANGDSGSGGGGRRGGPGGAKAQCAAGAIGPLWRSPKTTSGLDMIADAEANPDRCLQRAAAPAEVLQRRLMSFAEAVVTVDQDKALFLMGLLKQDAHERGDVMQRLTHYLLQGLAARSKGTGLQLWLNYPESFTQLEIYQALQEFFAKVPFVPFSMVSALGVALEAFERAADDAEEAANNNSNGNHDAHDGTSSPNSNHHAHANGDGGGCGEEAPPLPVLHIVDIGRCFDMWVHLLDELATLAAARHRRRRRPGPVHGRAAMPHVRFSLVTFVDTNLRKPDLMVVMVRNIERAAAARHITVEVNVVVAELHKFHTDMLRPRAGECLVVNCNLRLNLFSDSNVLRCNPRERFLEMLRSLGPRSMIVSEINADLSGPFFLERFKGAMATYSLAFEATDAAWPRDSKARQIIESVVLARELLNIVSCEGLQRVVRQESHDRWRLRMLRAGFAPQPFSARVLASLQGLMRRFPGWAIEPVDGIAYLTWRKRSRMMAASTWRPAF